MKSLKITSPASVPKTLVFTQTKDQAWKIFHMLQGASTKKEYVGMYHASISQNTKTALQHLFKSDDSTLRCLVATVAFGMVCTLYFRRGV